MDTPDVPDQPQPDQPQPDQPQPDQPQPGPAQTGRANELTITVTCLAHGARGFCNLRITKVGGEITLDPHVAGGCVLIFDETAATAVFDVFGQGLA